jgi:hypothetical protein
MATAWGYGTGAVILRGGQQAALTGNAASGNVGTASPNVTVALTGVAARFSWDGSTRADYFHNGSCSRRLSWDGSSKSCRSVDGSCSGGYGRYCFREYFIHSRAYWDIGFW